MKLNRSHRLIAMAHYLLAHPHTLVSLSYFVERFQSARSSISEDISILKKEFPNSNIGSIETIAGASGGVIFRPSIAPDQALERVQALCQELTDNDRILPGGYFYLTDILGDPDHLRLIGQIIASRYREAGATAIMTIATKGVPLAQAVSMYLNIPFVMVRRDSKVTEGATVSINYASQGQSRVEKMELTKNSLGEGEKVLIIDDFLNGGGTITGMLSMTKEFNASCVGICVLAEVHNPDRKVPFDYQSLMQVVKSQDNTQLVEVLPGSIFDDHE